MNERSQRYLSLLRNTSRNRLFLNEFKAHGMGGFLQCAQLSGLEFLFVILQSLEDIGFAMFD